MKRLLERKWMYERLDDRKNVRVEFLKGVKEFLEYATQCQEYITNKEMRCPCEKCRCLIYLDAHIVEEHLYTKGFHPRYFYWTCHGENYPPDPPETRVWRNDESKQQKHDIGKNVVSFNAFRWRNKRKVDAIDTNADMDSTKVPRNESSSTGVEKQACQDDRVMRECRILYEEAMKARIEMKMELEDSRLLIAEETRKFREETRKFWEEICKFSMENMKSYGEMHLHWKKILQFAQNNSRQPSNDGGGNGTGTGK